MFTRSLVSSALAGLLLLSPVASFAAEAAPHWSYGGATGPKQWAGLEKDYESCGLGQAQSPIDIRSTEAKKAHLAPIAFDYKPSPLKIVDNGHTVQVNYAPGSFITAGGQRWELLQFHFHKPSEEKIDGRGYAMVAHLVHRNAEGKLAVVAVLLAPGSANPLIKTLWDNLPEQKEVEKSVDAVTINVADLLPAKKAYYTFTGSLTTPPCSEGVTWLVLKTPKRMSDAQLRRFGHIYPMNARPVQPRHGREIRASD